jgi:hypothetical protein
MVDPEIFIDSWISVDSVCPWLGVKPFFVEGDRLGDLEGRLARAGFEVVKVDLGRMGSDEDFVAEFGRIVEVPSYFGNNWDALDEVLRDRSPGVAWRIALVILGGREFAMRNLHDYARIVSSMYSMGQRMSDLDATPAGQLETFYIDN